MTHKINGFLKNSFKKISARILLLVMAFCLPIPVQAMPLLSRVAGPSLRAVQPVLKLSKKTFSCAQSSAQWSVSRPINKATFSKLVSGGGVVLGGSAIIAQENGPVSTSTEIEAALSEIDLKRRQLTIALAKQGKREPALLQELNSLNAQEQKLRLILLGQLTASELSALDFKRQLDSKEREMEQKKYSLSYVIAAGVLSVTAGVAVGIMLGKNAGYANAAKAAVVAAQAAEAADPDAPPSYVASQGAELYLDYKNLNNVG